MHVAMGVNGIGIGHAMRQLALAEYLRERGHRITIIAEGRAEPLFRAAGYEVLPGWMPKILGDQRHILLKDAILANVSALPAGAKKLVRNVRRLRELGTPDVFVTDYEPNAAWLAYALRKPLVSIDQQSKFRYLNLPDINGFAQKVERDRLRLFMPRVTAAYACSFLPLEADSGDNQIVQYIPPILADTVRELRPTRRKLSAAYFSSYFDAGPERNVVELTESLRDDQDRELSVYVPANKLAELSYLASSKVRIQPVDRESFLKDLSESDSVFSNAGFNSISEAIFLGKPLYLCPLPTFDQNWCAETIETKGLGVNRPDCSTASVRAFLDRLMDFAEVGASELVASWYADPRARLEQALLSAAAGGRRTDVEL